MMMKQWVRVISGGCFLASVALALFVNKGWFIVTALIVLNLIQSAFTGWCPVKKVLGKLGVQDPDKPNCARIVATKLREQFPLEDETITRLSACAGGRAPEECCGAFYSAKNVLERYAPQRVEKSMEEFRSFAGSLKCREILKLKKKTCRECVRKAIEVVQGK